MPKPEPKSEPLELVIQQGAILLKVDKINKIIRALSTGKKSLDEIFNSHK